jgi:streptomycin 6-kinase
VDLSSGVVEATRRRLTARFGAQRVEPWWERLPGALAELAARWDIVVGDGVGRGNTSLVVRCRRADGRPAMLKLTPDAEIAGAEARALRSWASSGRVPLVWGFDATAGALLLEALPDETPLSEAGVDVGLRDIAGLIGALHHSGEPVIADGVVSLADRVAFIFDHWGQRHGRNAAVTRVVPVAALERGHALARELAAVAGAGVLLHGDLHPGNVLHGGSGRGLVAIDPRACVGDPAFDAVDWVPWATDDPRLWKPRGRELACALGADADRLWAWCTACAALLAAGEVARGGPSSRVQALLAVAP